ncbi:MAG: rhomboid family intramembrane serine protease [Solirubrobacteraceae bacterium]
MSTNAPTSRRVRRTAEHPGRRPAVRAEGIALLAAIVALMWVLEVVNSLDHNQLAQDGIHPRDLARVWGILTSPFLHVSFAHLISNTVPFVFMGLIIALRGAARLALVSLIVILVGGLGTWLIAPAHSNTIGASGVVFGFATYLMTRGIFNRSLLESLVGALVVVVWGGVLLSSLVPHYGVSWQDHACGALGGILAAWLLARRRAPRGPERGPGPRGRDPEPSSRATHAGVLAGRAAVRAGRALAK